MAYQKGEYFKGIISKLEKEAKAAQKEPKIKTLRVTIKHSDAEKIDKYIKRLEAAARKRREQIIKMDVPAKIAEQKYFRKIQQLDRRYKHWHRNKEYRLQAQLDKTGPAPKKPICPTCGYPQNIYKRKVCRKCFEKLTTQENQIKKLAGKPYKGRPAKRRVTGELQLFKRIWEDRSDHHYCETCGVGIMHFAPIHFHHILHKSLRPDLRLDAANIRIVCTDCHQKEHS